MSDHPDSPLAIQLLSLRQVGACLGMLAEDVPLLLAEAGIQVLRFSLPSGRRKARRVVRRVRAADLARWIEGLRCGGQGVAA